jgi:DNA topoisomerase-3
MVKIQSLSSLYQGKQFLNAKTKVTDHWTKPPAPFTEDSLLAMMERAGANEMEADVERKGLGTPATRAGIIEKLVSSKYVVRRNRQMIATDAGKQLVSAMPEYLKSPQMTADWENRLLQIERGQYDSRSFMDGITQLIRKMLQECGQIDEKERTRFDRDKSNTRGMDSRENLGKCPVCGSPVYEGKRSFYCSNRECRFVLWKENKFLERMRTCLDDGMVKDILSTGRTYVRNLYSVKRDKFFSAYLCMEWKDGKSRFRLDFTE